MTHTHSKNSFVNKFGFASLLIFVGIFLLLLQLEVISSQWKHIVFSWKMLVFVGGLFIFAKGKKLCGGIIMAVGLFFLAPALLPKLFPDVNPKYFANFTEKYWAILLIIAGVGIAIKKATNRTIRCTTHTSTTFANETHTIDEGFIQKKCSFGNCKYEVTAPEFTGGLLQSTFGSIVVDLRQTHLPETPVTLAIKVAFGAIEICVPADWTVEINVTPNFGAIEDTRTLSSESTHNKKLIIVGSIAFGGGEIRS
ncbi:MAG: cell wall-active antibiotics response protein [Bacteroidales bacterium]|jgi:predicted membrane protein|nr:cell wall-active antibiotics response protein [Bacteroidales bacterium]